MYGHADPPPLRSGHLDIRNAQFAETKDVLGPKGPRRCVKN